MKTRWFKCIWLGFLSAILLLTLVGWRPVSTTQPAVSEQAVTLPPEATSPVSALIGADQAAYHAMANSSGFRVDNSPHGLSALFTASGVLFDTGENTWGISLDAYGYGDVLQPVMAAAPTAHGNRIEYDRGPLNEWYLNGPFGLEQGFTLSVPPVKQGGQLTLALAMHGDLQAALEADGQGLSLSSPQGTEILRYTGLSAYDADRHSLRTWLEIQDAVLLVRVDDAGARYPLMIDPFIQTARLTASDKAEWDSFGTSVSISGNTIVVGAYLADPENTSEAGAAYVFVKPVGGWADMTQNAKLTASIKAVGDRFGYSVAISGDTIVVGAYKADPDGTTDAGAAYVFIKPAGGWADMTQTAKLTASDKMLGDWFGYSVAVSGDVAVVGAYWSRATGFTGAAYVFVKPGGGWTDGTQTAKLTASDKATNNYFGSSVSVIGDVVVVGAYGADPDGTTNAGAAYVFVKPGGGWADATQTAKLTASDKAPGNYFGRFVSIDADVIVIAAPLNSPGATPEAGAAYIFVKPGGGWADGTQTAKLTASDKSNYANFGSSVGISGDVVVVGARAADPGGVDNAGAAYVFLKPGGGWVNGTEISMFSTSDKAVTDYFGVSAAVSGKVVVVGADGLDLEGKSDVGAAYVFMPKSVTTIIADTPDPSLTGQAVNVSVIVTGDFGIPTGTVNITGAHNNCSISLSTGGGNCNVSFNTPGSKTLTATHSGDATYRGGSDTENHQVNPRSANFRSQGVYDGWVLESSETSSVGGTFDATAMIFFIGDDQADRQYRSILSFNTASLSDSAVIALVVLKIKKEELIGINPFSTHKPLLVDIRKPFFGAAIALAASDFQAVANKGSVGTFGTVPSSGWYSATLNSTAFSFINKTGTTQFRLRFKLDDDNDTHADYMKFYSGSYVVTNFRPILVISYYVP